MFKQVRLNDAILKFYQRSQPIAFSNAETLYDDLVLLRDQILMYGDLSEAQTNYLNEFIEKFDNELTSTTQAILSKWMDDGVLADIVRVAINDEVVESRDGESNLNLRLNRDKQDSDDKITLLQDKDDQIEAQLAQHKKKAVFTFVLDDHYIGDRRAFPLFAERGWVFNSAFIVNNMLNDFQASRNPYIDYYRRLADLGGSMLAHSMTHFDMRKGGLNQSEVEWQISQSKRSLELIGFKCSGWVSPYSQTHGDYDKYMRYYYNYAFNRYLENVTDSISGGGRVYHLPQDDIYKLTRVSLAPGRNSLSEIKQAIDMAIEAGGFICFYDHSIGGDTGTEISVANLEIILDYLKDYEVAGECHIYPTDQAVMNFFGASNTRNAVAYKENELPISSDYQLATTSVYDNLGDWSIGAGPSVEYTLNEGNIAIDSMQTGENVLMSAIVDVSDLDKSNFKEAVLNFSTNLEVESDHTADDIELNLEYSYLSALSSSSVTGTYGFFKNIEKSFNSQRYSIRMSPPNLESKTQGNYIRVTVRTTALKPVSNVKFKLSGATITY